MEVPINIIIRNYDNKESGFLGGVMKPYYYAVDNITY